MSDEALRRRLRHLAANDDDHLSLAAQERVLANVLATGPRLIRRARIERIAWRAAGATLAAAAAATLWLRVGADTFGSSGLVSKSADPPRGQSRVAATPPPTRAGESRGAPVNAAFRSFGDTQALDLGKTAYAVAAPGSEAVLEQSTSCRTVIALHKGRVSVHARDLGGGELLVRTRDAEIAVNGTVFSVSLEDGDVAVEVAEGTVVVQKPGASVRRVTAGTRVAFAKDLVAETALASEAKQTLLETTEAAPAPAPMFDADQTARAEEPRSRTSENQSSERLLSRADALRRSGDLEGARRLYREVGNGSGPSAEAAWLALARMELAAGNAKAARNATLEREKRFKSGALGPEALWINVRTNRQAGNTAAARRAAEDLVRRWPKSPQAAAAKRWLDEGSE